MSPPVAFLTDWLRTKPFPSRVQRAMFAEVLRPLSATTTTRSPSGSSALRSPARSIMGTVVDMSLALPGKSWKSTGIPSLSMSSPVCTMASGLCSLGTPFLLSPLPSTSPSSSPSISNQ